MRRWFVLLLIALLPLRGWVGEALAAPMLAQHVAAAAAHAQVHAQGEGHGAGHAHGTHDAHAAMLHDCAGHTPAHDAAAPQDGAAQDPGDCGTCAACQVCSAVALAVPSASTLVAAFGLARPAQAEPLFASAEPSQGVKPPIS
jgi:hypothetical protein